MTTTFEWDDDKSRLNARKHGSSFEEGKTVFNDPFAITIGDPDHSDDESRYIDIGISCKGKLLVVWYTDRNENIRLIGCRKATRSERKAYEERKI